MFDLFGLGSTRTPVGADVVGTIIEWNGKKYQALLRVEAFQGSFLAIEVGEDGQARYGVPIVMVQHAPTVLLDLDSAETKNRMDFTSTWQGHTLEGFKWPERNTWERDRKAADHPKTCRANYTIMPYTGHRDGTVETDPPFLSTFCPAHRAIINAWYVASKAVPDSWPPRKAE